MNPIVHFYLCFYLVTLVAFSMSLYLHLTWIISAKGVHKRGKTCKWKGKKYIYSFENLILSQWANSSCSSSCFICIDSNHRSLLPSPCLNQPLVHSAKIRFEIISWSIFNSKMTVLKLAKSILFPSEHSAYAILRKCISLELENSSSEPCGLIMPNDGKKWGTLSCTLCLTYLRGLQ